MFYRGGGAKGSIKRYINHFHKEKINLRRARNAYYKQL